MPPPTPRALFMMAPACMKTPALTAPDGRGSFSSKLERNGRRLKPTLQAEVRATKAGRSSSPSVSRGSLFFGGGQVCGLLGGDQRQVFVLHQARRTSSIATTVGFFEVVGR